MAEDVGRLRVAAGESPDMPARDIDAYGEVRDALDGLWAAVQARRGGCLTASRGPRRSWGNPSGLRGRFGARRALFGWSCRLNRRKPDGRDAVGSGSGPGGFMPARLRLPR